MKSEKRAKVWCKGCDKELVVIGKKCSVRGHKEGSKNYMKLKITIRMIIL
jgi:RNase P subunit RPR2